MCTNLPFRHVVELLRHRADSQPEQPAFTWLERGEKVVHTLTFSELDRQARAIAVRLRNDSKPGDRALLLYPPGLDFVTAFLGCLYARLVAVPAYPPRNNHRWARLAAIAADASATLVLTTNKLVTQARSVGMETFGGQTRFVAADHETVALHLADNWIDPVVNGGDLAFLQYTSGSTGAPKGVMVTHRNLIYNEHMAMLAFGHGPHTVFVGWLPLFHDMGLIGNVLQPLYVGVHSIMMAPAAFVQKPVRWLQAITRFKATTSGAPNSAFDLCVDRIGAVDKVGLDLSSWQVAFNGAEPIHAETLVRFQHHFADVGFRPETMYPCYGMAETTLLVSGGIAGQLPVTERVSAEALQAGRAEATADAEDGITLVGSGRTWLKQSIVIAESETGQRLLDGQIGEVWVSGENVADGYWRRPELSQSTFEAVLTPDDGRRYLRTGDLGYLRDGNLFVTGRLKDVLIVFGRNHYPQDLERTACAAAAVFRAHGAAAFTIHEQGADRVVIVQEVERRAIRTLDVAEAASAIRRALAEHHDLPLYAVAFIKPSALPRTTSGKVQRFRCRQAFLAGELAEVARWQQSGQATTPVLDGDDPSLSPLVRFLAAELGVDPALLELNQPVAATGLDSLRILTLQHAVDTAMEISSPPSWWLGDLSVGELEQRLTQWQQDPEGLGVTAEVTNPPAIDVPPVDPEVTSHALSAGQSSLWFAQQMNAKSGAFNVFFVVCCQRAPDPIRLQRAVAAVHDHHDLLSIQVSHERGHLFARRGAHGAPILQHHTLHAGQPGDVSKAVAAEVYRPFDLKTDPLWRVTLFQSSDGEAQLLITVHHLVCDLTSLLVIVEDLERAYQGFGLGEPPPPFRAFLKWQADLLAGSARAELEAYWQAHSPTPDSHCEWDTGRPRPKRQTLHGASVPLTWQSEQLRLLRASANRAGVTLQTYLLAGFVFWFGARHDARDVGLGAMANGRPGRAYDHTVGYFSNPFPMRFRWQDDQSFGDWIRQVRDTVTGALDHQWLPFPDMVHAVGPERDASRTPLFQIMFVHQQLERAHHLAPCVLNDSVQPLTWAGLPCTSMQIDKQVARYDLTLYLIEVDGALHGHLLYNRDLFAEDLALSIGTSFSEMTSAMTQWNLTDRLGDLRQALLLQQAPDSAAAGKVRMT